MLPGRVEHVPVHTQQLPVLVGAFIPAEVLLRAALLLYSRKIGWDMSEGKEVGIVYAGLLLSRVQRWGLQIIYIYYEKQLCACFYDELCAVEAAAQWKL